MKYPSLNIIALTIFILTMLVSCVGGVHLEDIYGEWKVTDVYLNTERWHTEDATGVLELEGSIIEFKEDRTFVMRDSQNQAIGGGIYALVVKREQMMLDFGRIKFLYDVKYLTKKGGCLQFNHDGEVVYRLYFEPLNSLDK